MREATAQQVVEILALATNLVTLLTSVFHVLLSRRNHEETGRDLERHGRALTSVERSLTERDHCPDPPASGSENS